jgi:hypothetical protein
MSIRYYRKQADGRINDQAADGVAAVPAQDIVLRSTLPPSAEMVLRSAKPPLLLSSISHLIYPLGLSLIAVSLITVALGFIGTMKRRARATPRDSARPQPIDYQSVLNTITHGADSGDPEALRRAFAKLEHLLRQCLAETDPQATSLTPEEIDTRASVAGDVTVPSTIARVLRECERARFGGPAQPLSGEQLVQALDQAQTVFVSVPIKQQ